MAFISYAQNLEDVMLARALANVERGFYVDVGACEPTADSVTRAFYDRGWRGINLEPAPGLLNALQRERPEDKNLAIAAGAAQGEVTFYHIGQTGLSTTDAETAARHRQTGWAIEEVRVPVSPLNDVLAQHAGGEIHFLKIDVEGGERNVLLGLDLTRYRPWIIVVEATEALSQTLAHEIWDDLISGQHYRFMYFDGLNRFYLAAEHEELAPAFAAPPNVFDGYVRYSEAQAGARAEKSRVHAEEMRTALANLSVSREQTGRLLAEAQTTLARERESSAQCLAQTRAERDEAQATLRRLSSSVSWRMTAPLRQALVLARRAVATARLILARARASP